MNHSLINGTPPQDSAAAKADSTITQVHKTFTITPYVDVWNLQAQHHRWTELYVFKNTALHPPMWDYKQKKISWIISILGMPESITAILPGQEIFAKPFLFMQITEWTAYAATAQCSRHGCQGRAVNTAACSFKRTLACVQQFPSPPVSSHPVVFLSYLWIYSSQFSKPLVINTIWNTI